MYDGQDLLSALTPSTVLRPGYDRHLLFIYYLGTVRALMKLVALLWLTSLLGIRLLHYSGASGLM